MAWQLIAGVYMPISDNIDLGVKYRYFRTGKLNFNDSFTFPAVGAGTSGGTAFFDVHDRFSSHSVLASLVYNFGAPLPSAASAASAPAASAAASPATQTARTDR